MNPPFPWMGGKRRIAVEVWRRFGRVSRYTEPFFGGGAVLLGRPVDLLGGVEVVNDADGLLVNFWRAVQADPSAVAIHAEHPISEIDLTARHSWLSGQRERITERLLADPFFYDPLVAGWWVWGASQWMADGWCIREPKARMPEFMHARGVHAMGDIGATLCALAARLRGVRILCGDWSRVLHPSGGNVPSGSDIRAVFLDPPYDVGAAYAGGGGVVEGVRQWAVERGASTSRRIAVCGYAGTWNPPKGWSVFEWSTSGGYSNKARAGRGKRECVWFSPHCLP